MSPNTSVLIVYDSSLLNYLYLIETINM